MKINFNEIPENVVQGLRGGQGEARVKTFSDADNRLMMITLAPGAFIGRHTHEKDSETIYILKGQGTMDSEEGSLPAAPGECHYCARGQWHSLKNTGNEDLVVFAVIPTHGK